MFTKDQWMILYFSTSEYALNLYELGFDDEGKQASNTHDMIADHMAKNGLFK